MVTIQFIEAIRPIYAASPGWRRFAMYVKPEVTRYNGKELLDLMGPVETQYAMNTCDIIGTESGVGTQADPIQYRDDDPGDDPIGLFELSIPVARIEDRCEDVGEDPGIFVNFLKNQDSQPCEQWSFP
jgi:hypothetical protein